MWDITHKKIDESYVNEKAKEIAEKIEVHSSQQPMELTVNSPLDALGVVFGKEHPGRVRGLGMGAVPIIAFKNNTTRISQMNLGSSNDAGTSSTCGPNVQEELDTVKAQLQALVSYIASKEGGKIPIQLAGMFPTQQISQGLDQESEIPSPKELGSSYKPLWDIIDARWDKQLFKPLHVAGYYLNPQIHYSPNFKVEYDVKKGLL
ncbi:uncharacterized protein LOC107632684 [Arachis ipaensis]|uniref:uncharacterized protein LOC107632684 n=1 Tax=Arachis ipaensis TaxID=130454 RepID=UPI0007AF23B7|nr:uncharacterized protein LOC107632684 [Arachis ipaensis]